MSIGADKQVASDAPKRRTLFVDDIIAETGLSRTAVYAALRDGTIPSMRVGKRILVSRVVFERWLSGEDGAK